MKRQMRIFLAGALVVVPMAVTLYVLVALGSWLDDLANGLISLINEEVKLPRGLGAVTLVALVYIVGLLTHVWIFRGLFARVEKTILRVPGAKVIYESVRDLLKLFGGQAGSMGRVVEYRPEGSDVTMLGIMTNEHPNEVIGEDDLKVAVYLPLSLMVGGPTIYTSSSNLRELDMPVEEALKLATTAHLGSGKATREDQAATKE